MTQDTGSAALQTIGMDLGDSTSCFEVLDAQGCKIEEGSFPTTREGLARLFSQRLRSRVALEVGAHSPWVSRALRQWGHEVFVANPRKFRLIGCNENKTDRVDADLLARVARVDPQLLFPVWHRDTRRQADLVLLRARACLVRSRTRLVNYVRGTVKASGESLPRCEAEAFARRMPGRIPGPLAPALEPLLASIGALNEQIARLETQIAQTAQQRYPETQLLRQVPGVGPITSFAFVLVVADPHRFARSRRIGSYLGLRPRKADSSQSRPQLPITKAGDAELRGYLVQCAQQILRRHGPDSALRRHGLKIAQVGGKNAKKRALIAVARKLSVVLLRIWKTGEAYQPFYGLERKPA